MMKNKFTCKILIGEVYFHRWDLTFNSLITLLDHTTAEVEKSKDNNIEPCFVCTDSNVVQLFCLLAVHYFPLTKFV